MRWFETYLRKVLAEAGDGGLRISNIVLNVCNMEPQLFETPHTYDQAWREIYQFLRQQSTKPGSPYHYVADAKTGAIKRGYFRIDPETEEESLQMRLNL